MKKASESQAVSVVVAVEQPGHSCQFAGRLRLHVQFRLITLFTVQFLLVHAQQRVEHSRRLTVTVYKRLFCLLERRLFQPRK